MSELRTTLAAAPLAPRGRRRKHSSARLLRVLLARTERPKRTRTQHGVALTLDKRRKITATSSIDIVISGIRGRLRLHRGVVSGAGGCPPLARRGGTSSRTEPPSGWFACHEGRL